MYLFFHGAITQQNKCTFNIILEFTHAKKKFFVYLRYLKKPNYGIKIKNIL